MKNTIGIISNYLVALLLIAFGVTYIFKPSWMPYHAEALERSWESVEVPVQILILALMRAVGGGFLACGLGIGMLQRQQQLEPKKWIPVAILGIGLMASAGSLYATYTVNSNTNGGAPFSLALICVVLLIIGYLLNRNSDE